MPKRNNTGDHIEKAEHPYAGQRKRVVRVNAAQKNKGRAAGEACMAALREIEEEAKRSRNKRLPVIVLERVTLAKLMDARHVTNGRIEAFHSVILRSKWSMASVEKSFYTADEWVLVRTETDAVADGLYLEHDEDADEV